MFIIRAGHEIEYFCFARQMVSFSKLFNLIKLTRVRFSIRVSFGTIGGGMGLGDTLDCVLLSDDRVTR